MLQRIERWRWLAIHNINSGDLVDSLRLRAARLCLTRAAYLKCLTRASRVKQVENLLLSENSLQKCKSCAVKGWGCRCFGWRLGGALEGMLPFVLPFVVALWRRSQLENLLQFLGDANNHRLQG